MRVEIFPADHGACGFYRLRLPAACSGVEVTTSEAVTVGWRDGQVVDARSDADVVVLQRPSRWSLVATIPFLQARGVAVVVEMDDDFNALDPANPAWWLTQPRSGTGQDAAAINAACRIADLVTVTTPALARRYAPHCRVVVLPNCVPAAYLDVAGAHDRVGWAGSVATHPNDLQVTRGAVGTALHGERFHVIGDGDGVRANLCLDHDPTVTGIVPLEQYPAEVAALAVGIVPLADSAFNRAKSALKLLEYAALGVAAVASPTPDNQRVHADGIGSLAWRPRDWRRLLVCDPEQVDRSRDAVRRLHTIETNAWRWAEAWARALVTRRSVAA